MPQEKSLEEKLFEDGLVWIHSGINDKTIDDVIYTLMALKENNPEKPIQLYITCTNPDFTHMIAIYDVLRSLPNPLVGFAIGKVDNYGTLILAACDKGKRFALKNTVIGLSQPLGQFDSLTLETDAVIAAKEAAENRRVFEELMSKHTGQPIDKIHADLKDGMQMNPEEAMAYGIIDKILD